MLVELLHEEALKKDPKTGKTYLELIDEKLEEIDNSGVVYMVRIKRTDFVKIGYTTNLDKRMSSLRTSNPLELEVITKVSTNPEMEKEVQHLFEEYHYKGEWYRFPENLINKLIGKAPAIWEASVKKRQE